MLHLSFYQNENLHLKSLKQINNINKKFKNEILELNNNFPNRKKNSRITKKKYKKKFLIKFVG